MTTCLVWRYVRDHAGDEGLRELLARANLDLDGRRLTDEKAWFTYEEKIALFAAAAATLGEPHVMMHMGEQILDYRVGAAQRALLAIFGSPRFAVRQFPRAGAQINRAAVTTVLSVHRNEAVVAYKLNEGKEPSRLECEYNIGIFRALGPMFGRPLCDVTHTDCQVEGAERCVFEIRWNKRRWLTRRGGS